MNGATPGIILFFSFLSQYVFLVPTFSSYMLFFSQYGLAQIRIYKKVFGFLNKHIANFSLLLLLFSTVQQN